MLWRNEHRAVLSLAPDARMPLQIEQQDEAENMFSRLMGDVVEPRREFIQDNA